MRRLSTPILILILLFVIGFMVQQAGVRTFPEPEVEVAVTMHYLERFAERLHFAGEAGNWRLAAFYLDELEETIEPLITRNVMEFDVSLGRLSLGYFLPAISGMREAVQEGDPGLFTDRYSTLIASCNSCHEASYHPFIRVTPPAGPPPRMLDLKPEP